MLLPAIFSNIAIAPINSPNKTVMATNAEVKRLGSIIDNTNREAASTPMAIAIFFKVSAFTLCCRLSKESFTVPNMDFM